VRDELLRRSGTAGGLIDQPTDPLLELSLEAGLVWFAEGLAQGTECPGVYWLWAPSTSID